MSTRTRRLALALGALVLGSPWASACVLDVSDVRCTFGGRTYEPGDTFLAADGCNDCSCEWDGTVHCTADPCPTRCVYGGKTYVPGQSFPALDGCNTCSCGLDGNVACTAMACASCVYAGVTYRPGDAFAALDGCNTCECTLGGAGGAQVACTDRACACDPEREWYRHYVARSPEQCALVSYACPPNTRDFSNACGCGCEQDASCPQWFDCMPPTACDVNAIHERCPCSGIAY